MRAGLRPTAKAVDLPPDSNVGAPAFYPTGAPRQSSSLLRSERINSLDVETAQDCRKAGLGFARDPEIRAVVILTYIHAGGERSELVTSRRRPQQFRI